MYSCATWQHVCFFITPPPACRGVHSMYTRNDVSCFYQLSESTSLLLCSLFSADALVALFHFCEFSDSSEEERFCLLHFARLFLNQTYVIEEKSFNLRPSHSVSLISVAPLKNGTFQLNNSLQTSDFIQILTRTTHGFLYAPFFEMF